VDAALAGKSLSREKGSPEKGTWMVTRREILQGKERSVIGKTLVPHGLGLKDLTRSGDLLEKKSGGNSKNTEGTTR